MGIKQITKLPILTYSASPFQSLHKWASLEMPFKNLWFWSINPFTLTIFDPSPQKNCDVIYGPPLGLILTYMNVLCIWMYIRALSESKFKLSNQDGWFIKSQKVSIENGYEENTQFKFLPHLKLKSETSILLLL